MSSQKKVVSIVNGNPDDNKIDTQPPKAHNRGGGGNNMGNKDYVTHEELELSNEKILRHIDQKFSEFDKNINKRFDNVDQKFKDVDLKFEKVNTKFEKQKVWLLTTAISIVAASCTIIGFLIKFIK